jgi:hypothetical protein
MCGTARNDARAIPIFSRKECFGKEQPMGHIVMTLLVRRQPVENADCRYAVQITFPREMSPGGMTSLTSARLIQVRGIKSTASETMDYRPEQWRAADLSEQAQYASQFGGNPRPWYCVMRSLCRSVYDYPGSGHKESNNGQVWTGTELLDEEWKTQRKMRQKCEEELDAEWQARVSPSSAASARFRTEATGSEACL